MSVLLLAVVSRRQGAVAEDIQAAADFAEVIVSMKLHKHGDDALQAAHDYLTNDEPPLWS